MAGQPPGHLQWQEATVSAAKSETETARTIVLQSAQWDTHRAGQHIDIRLTAPDGYQATRSYSISSAPGEAPQITVERVEDGEVSSFLLDVLAIGDIIEIRGPIGGYFVADPSPSPLLLIAGGSGIAPLRAMWRAAPATTEVTILYSARDRTRVIFRDELEDRDRVRTHLTRESAPGYIAGRVDRDSLMASLDGSIDPRPYVCGPTAFVETVISALKPLLNDPRSIRAERFG